MATMNTAALAALGRAASEFAQCYTALVDALVKEGVPEATARQDARAAAAMVAMMPEGEQCPLCGR